MKTSQIIASATVAAMLAASVTTTANAQELTTCKRFEREFISIPYIEDVNDWGNGYRAIISVCGNSNATLRVTCNGKPIKAKKLDARSWVATIKRGKLYKITAKPAHGKARSIGYAIYQ